MSDQLKMTFNELYERCIYSSTAHAVANLRIPSSIRKVNQNKEA